MTQTTTSPKASEPQKLGSTHPIPPGPCGPMKADHRPDDQFYLYEVIDPAGVLVSGRRYPAGTCLRDIPHCDLLVGAWLRFRQVDLKKGVR